MKLKNLIILWGGLLALQSGLASEVKEKLSPLDLERCQKAKDLAKQGDIVFIDTKNPVLIKLSQTTGGWATHNGIIVEEKGELIIIESNIPRVKTRKFCDFFKSALAHFELKRVKSINYQNIKEVVRLARAELGTWYDIGFDYHSKRMFCSKFLYKIFLFGEGIEIGKVETFEELIADNPKAPVGFWKTYFLGQIPWKRSTISPQSQYVDTDLETIYSFLVPKDDNNTPL